MDFELHMELCDSESFAKKSHPQNVIGDLHPFEWPSFNPCTQDPRILNPRIQDPQS